MFLHLLPTSAYDLHHSLFISPVDDCKCTKFISHLETLRLLYNSVACLSIAYASSHRSHIQKIVILLLTNVIWNKEWDQLSMSAFNWLILSVDCRSDCAVYWSSHCLYRHVCKFRCCSNFLWSWRIERLWRILSRLVMFILSCDRIDKIIQST